MADSLNFKISKTTKSNPPRLPFLKIKEDVLGKEYNLSLVFIGDQFSKKLNSKYRAKKNPTNVLSFPYDKDNGEIFLNLKRAGSESKKFGLNKREFTALLFIHSLFHLKGFEHGSTMEKKEKEIIKKFKLY